MEAADCLIALVSTPQASVEETVSVVRKMYNMNRDTVLFEQFLARTSSAYL